VILQRHRDLRKGRVGVLGDSRLVQKDCGPGLVRAMPVQFTGTKLDAGYFRPAYSRSFQFADDDEPSPHRERDREREREFAGLLLFSVPLGSHVEDGGMQDGDHHVSHARLAK